MPAINSLPGVNKVRSLIVDLLDEIGSPNQDEDEDEAQVHSRRHKQRIARYYLGDALPSITQPPCRS